MQLTDLNTKLFAAALVALPIALTGCGDDVPATETSDGSTGSSGDDTNTTNPSTTLTTTTDPGTTTDPTAADSSSGGPTTETTGPDTDGTTSETDTSQGTSSGGESSSSGGSAECGDGVINGTEECDGDDLGDAVCPVVGDIVCADDCTLDMSACTDTLVLCNTPAAALDATTTADAPLLDTISVTDDLFVTDVNVTVDISHPWIDDLTGLIVAPDATNGAVLFNRPCGQNTDIDARYDDDGLDLVCNDGAPAVSGDVIPLTELRDLIGISAMGDWVLASWDNYSPADDGVLNEWCVELTLSMDDPVTCGDDVAHYGEACDGIDLNGAECVSLGMGFIGGTLGCLDDCTFDTSACVAPGCNGGIIDAGEECDGADLGGVTCADLPGFGGGTLACAGDCTFDTSMCTSSCGTGTIDAGEECDGADLGGLGCGDIPGFVDGTLACAGDCTFDTSMCNLSCGNGSIDDPTEDCDGTDLGGLTCDDFFGFTGSGLACDASCGFDTSGCTPTGGIEVCSAPGSTITNTAAVDDIISVADTGTIADLDVFIDITHTWDADLDITLFAPSGTSVILVQDQCGSDDNVSAIFDDEGVALDCNFPVADSGITGDILPAEALSAFDTQAFNGDWTLNVVDDASGDDGTLNEWCLRITPQ